ncbi:MAG: aminopeptidase [Candidatus Kerfeldbacteria bacterium]|nr:aminopeptidase [Candidatus Kerfeldbacteria bacterium]
MDSQNVQFADQLVNYCTEVKPGELVIIQANDGTPYDLIDAVIDSVNRAGGSVAAVWLNSDRVTRKVFSQLTPHAERICHAGPLVQAMATQVCIVFRGFDNIYEWVDVPRDKMRLASSGMGKHLQDQRIQHTRWILTRMWTPGMAQLAGMSQSAFHDYYMKTVLLDYGRMSRAMDPLFDLVNQTEDVRIKGPGKTNLRFSIAGIGAVKCDGKRNIPDGEVYTAPVRESMNGVIQYNTVTVTKEGQRFENVCFEVKRGKIIKATCGSGDERRLNDFLDTDEGARYFGEFAFGVNPHILMPIGETLFDEKIAGSFHLTPGQSYTGTPAENGNNSAIHWDIVCIQRPEFGGGEIWFDGKLIRKNGLFVPKRLLGLNPDQLIAA